MKTKTTNSGIKVKANVKAGLKAGTTDLRPNHSSIALKIR